MPGEKILLDEALLFRIVYGSAFLGSGGGGKIASGEKFIEIIKRGKPVQLLTFPLSPKDEQLMACIVCDMGSINQFDEKQHLALEYAFNSLKEYFESDIPVVKALFPIETGAENTLAPVALAAMLGLVVIDGDGASRAVPTLPLTTFSALGELTNFTPVAIASGEGDVMLVGSKTKASFEALLRPITALKQFNNSASLALWPDVVKKLAKNCIPGTITQAMFCGQLLEGIRKNDKTLISTSLERVNKLTAVLLAMGRVDSVTSIEENAFNFAVIEIQNQLKNETITVLSQNESLVAYSNISEGPIALAPDSICYLNSEFWPVTNSEIKKCDKIYLIAVMANERLKDPVILKGFRKIINKLGYSGNMDLKYPKTKPLGSLLLTLKQNRKYEIR